MAGPAAGEGRRRPAGVDGPEPGRGVGRHVQDEPRRGERRDASPGGLLLRGGGRPPPDPPVHARGLCRPAGRVPRRMVRQERDRGRDHAALAGRYPPPGVSPLVDPPRQRSPVLRALAAGHHRSDRRQGGRGSSGGRAGAPGSHPWRDERGGHHGQCRGDRGVHERGRRQHDGRRPKRARVDADTLRSDATPPEDGRACRAAHQGGDRRRPRDRAPTPDPAGAGRRVRVAGRGAVRTDPRQPGSRRGRGACAA